MYLKPAKGEVIKMYLIGYTEKYRELGQYLKKILELDKEKIILVKIEPEANGGDKDIFEVIHYDNQGVSYAYSKEEITQMILKTLLAQLSQLLSQLPN